MPVSLIAAISENNCIGINGGLPWNIPEDMQHFKRITTGHPVLMGRKTWESIPLSFRPLKNRTNIVITRDPSYSVPKGVFVFTDLEKAIQSQNNQEIMVIGGAELYKQTLPFANTLYITHVHKKIEGDAFFPEIDQSTWQEKERKNFTDFSFVTYIRRRESSPL